MACPPRDAFQIGWICALPIEAAAAAEMLDEDFGILQEQDAADTNTYTLGRVGRHHVVIACLPGGQYGTTSATTVANNMIRTFSKSLRVGLMVGIGGGIPSATHDIRLGDIVISCPQGNYGGVIQYDMGKVVAGGEFERTGSLNSPPRALLTAIGAMRAAALRDDPRYPEFLRHATQRTTRTRKNFARPKTEVDRLFKPQYEHPTTASACDICLDEWEVIRSQRENDDPQPHYGIIASGNSVVKHGKTREQLRSKTGALCFEMEAAGLMQDFPCIVIRGVCDYADSHKNKEWTCFARDAGSGYQIQEEVKGTNQRLDQAHDQRERLHREQKARALTDQQQRCHQALKITNYEQQKNINPIPAEGTCQWALQSPEYTYWYQNNHNDLLWVSADPGCGKSVLARSIVDAYLSASDPAIVTCYFFFKDNDDQNRVAAALCSVLHQLFSQRPDLLDHAVPSFQKNGEKLSQDVGELWRIFRTVTSTSLLGKTVCIFDALDECYDDDRAQLIHNLSCFHSPPRSSRSSDETSYMKFLVTSRPYDHIQEDFQASQSKFSHIHLKGEEENDVIRKEIDLMVKMRVQELAETANLSSDIQQRLEQQLLQMEHRTYLWLHLALDDIRSTFKNSLRPGEASIRMIPTTVNAAYEKILSRVPSSELDVVRKALQMIVAARRPLTVAEMAVALGIATCLDLQTVSEARLDASLIGKKLRRLCGLFVFVNNSKIYLIHQTAREFLIAKTVSTTTGFIYPWTLSEAEAQMGSVCLRYLLMEDLERDEDGSDSEAFLEYSAAYWPGHVRAMALNSEPRIVIQLHQLYDTRAKLFSLWFPIFWQTFRPNGRIPILSALHIAAFNGHEQEVDYLLEVEKSDINTADSTSAYPITWASLNGHDKIVQMLLDKGADVNAQGGGYYGNALQAACSNGHDKIVQMLLEKKADVNAQGGDCGDALQAACSEGHDKIVQMLLDKGADVNAQGGDYGNALQAACSNGHDKIAQILLEKKADVNAQGGYYGNALQAACSEGHDKIVQMLLDKGADVNAQDGDYRNALQAACSEGHDKIIQMLLDKGADVNAQGGYYGNALQAACSEGHDKIVQMLLDKGADVNAQDGDYRNALQAACSEGHDKIIQMLLDKGADVNAQGGYYGNALQAACSNGHDKIAQMLLEKKADVNAQGGYHGNALQAACSNGHDKIAQMLLEKKADVNAQGGYHGNALQAACSNGHNKIVQMLLKATKRSIDTFFSSS
ncbi:purine and uridine phosphorylase [Penicillium malachiteum]|uniref:Purine and uridine phosphorylase n=1 Tax=Penicillium malachiteum TaxID=1324776 RepID=A0AAD6MQG4_9EURO|nr:purine and uridine phosphorylase [Penicillium malachiteum]